VENTLVGPVDAKDRVEVTIKLRRKNREGFPTLEEFLDGKRIRLTRQELEERYGGSHEDAARVQAWAKSNGLSTSRIHLGKRRLELVGSAENMEKAFGVKLSHYTHGATGVGFRRPEKEAAVPRELRDIVVGVFGLDETPVIRRHITKARQFRSLQDPAATNPFAFYPPEVRALYQFPDTTGKGQKVAILEFGGGFTQAELDVYFQKYLGFKSTPTVNPIVVPGGKEMIDREVTGEVYLDIEVVGGMAPDAIIDVYFAAWTGDGYLKAVEDAIHNDDYAAISISYGLNEDLPASAQQAAWPQLKDNVDEAFAEAVAVGISIFVSAGDQGSGDGQGILVYQGQELEVTVPAPAAHAEYPASSPYATGVGGTMLFAKDGKITNETVWNELGPEREGPLLVSRTQTRNGPFYLGGATGGGVSDRYPAVPSYQAAAGVRFQSANSPATTGRCVPDVAGNAGAMTGYLVTQPPGSRNPVDAVGGTSAAAPMWAALMACVREALGQVPVFFFNDFAYAAGKSGAFNDIVEGVKVDPQQQPPAVTFTPTGDNRSSVAKGYFASAGYDLCTGWGSPNGRQLLIQLAEWLKTQPK